MSDSDIPMTPPSDRVFARSGFFRSAVNMQPPDDMAIPASQAAPLDLTPFRAADTIDPKLRRMLIDVGARLSMAMAIKDQMPEAVAAAIKLPPDRIERIRAGTEADVGIGTLYRIAAALGCPLQISVAFPVQPQPQGGAS